MKTEPDNPGAMKKSKLFASKLKTIDTENVEDEDLLDNDIIKQTRNPSSSSENNSPPVSPL